MIVGRFELQKLERLPSPAWLHLNRDICETETSSTNLDILHLLCCFPQKGRQDFLENTTRSEKTHVDSDGVVMESKQIIHTGRNWTGHKITTDTARFHIAACDELKSFTGASKVTTGHVPKTLLADGVHVPVFLGQWTRRSDVSSCYPNLANVFYLRPNLVWSSGFGWLEDEISLGLECILDHMGLSKVKDSLNLSSDESRTKLKILRWINVHAWALTSPPIWFDKSTKASSLPFIIWIGRKSNSQQPPRVPDKLE